MEYHQCNGDSNCSVEEPTSIDVADVGCVHAKETGNQCPGRRDVRGQQMNPLYRGRGGISFTEKGKYRDNGKHQDGLVMVLSQRTRHFTTTKPTPQN